MSGGGIGSALGGAGGTALGLALAPETGGLSLAVPAVLGAAGGALGGGLGSVASGGSNPWGAALGGGATGLLGGVASGLLSPAADAANAGEAAAVDAAAPAATDAAASAAPAATDATSQIGQAAASAAPSSVQLPGTAATTGGSGSWLSNLIGGGSGSTGSAAGNVAGTAAKTAASGSGGLSQYLVPAGLGLGALSLLFPQGSNPVNTSNVTNAQAANGASLPSYNYNSSSTPYTGSWYTYGQRPQTPMITNTITPAAHGGLMQKFSHGGTVRSLAIGGLPMQAPMGPSPQMPPAQPQMNPASSTQGMPASQMPSPQQNPLQQAAQFQMGQKIGQALRKHIKGQGMTSNGIVTGSGKGQDDAIPAKLSQDEYVLPADIPSFLGDGSSKAGGKVLDKFVQDVRKQKTSRGDKFPPKAKNPLSYIHEAST